MTFVIRPAGPGDLEDVVALARILNTLNLPNDRSTLKQLLNASARSFAGQVRSKKNAVYVFALEDSPACKVVGVSMIFAQHGTARMPHLYLQIKAQQKQSKTLKLKVSHRMLELGWDKDGPTELGGLVLDPAYRGHPQKLGKQLFMARLKYIVEHPQRFKKRLLVELLPPFRANGSSPFWDEWGGRFIPLTYPEADRLSRTNKEFILALFPRNGMYLNLFSTETQAVIGQAGGGSLASEKYLKEVGFKFLDQVDVFDGGPHYGARVEEIQKKVRTFQFSCSLNNQ